MPIERRKGKWWWGSKGPFDSRQKAEDVAQAAHASGYEGSALEKFLDLQKYWRDPKAGRKNRLGSSAGDRIKGWGTGDYSDPEWYERYPHRDKSGGERAESKPFATRQERRDAVGERHIKQFGIPRGDPKTQGLTSLPEHYEGEAYASLRGRATQPEIDEFNQRVDSDVAEKVIGRQVAERSKAAQESYTKQAQQATKRKQEEADEEAEAEIRHLGYMGIVNQNPMERQQQAESLKTPPGSGLEQFVTKAADKVSKSEAGYRHATPEELQSNVMCGTCDYYNNDETCDRVDGTFHSEDYCKFYKASGMNKFMKFQKNYATTSSTGSSTGGPSYFNATYGDSGPAPKKKAFRNATYDVTKGFDVPHEEVMFTSIESAAKAFKNMGKKTKDKAGAGRAAEFLDDKSPDMGAMKYEKAYGESHSGLVKVSPGQNAYNERKQSRRVLNTGKGGGGANTTSGKSMSTTPDHSTATTLIGKNEADVIINSTFTTDLIKWVIQQSRIEKAGADQYGIRTLPNELPYNPMRGGDRNLKAKNKKGSPTTEKTVGTGTEVHYPNMGQAGGFEAGIATHDPAGPENPANMTGTRPPDKGRHIGKNQGGAYLASANQGGMNMQGMEKGIAGGGTPHVFSISQPNHGGEAEQTKQYIEGKSELDKNLPPDGVEERSREKRKRDRKDAVPGMDGPSTDDAGAAIASIGNPIAQLMEKQGFEYEVDALHRGGSLDEDADLPEDDEDIEQAELQSLKQFAKMVMEGNFTIGKTYGL